VAQKKETTKPKIGNKIINRNLTFNEQKEISKART
jgi:hypothetical protein